MTGREENPQEAWPEGKEQRTRARLKNGEGTEEAPGSGPGPSGALGTDASMGMGSERQPAKTPRAQAKRSWFSRKKKQGGSPSPPRTGAGANSSVSPVKEAEEPMIMD